MADCRYKPFAKKRFAVLVLFVFALATNGLFAQQEAMNAQFILNTMSINPGYTGYKEVQSITVDHRSQWVGFKGAPITNTIGFDMVLPRNKELALGGNLMHDKIGPTSELSLSANVAYRFQTSRDAYMSIGIKGYAGLFQANYTDLDLTSEVFGENDINFSHDPSNQLITNFGIGAYYHSEDYFLGFSSPRLLKTHVENRDLNTYNTIRGRTEPTYYLMAGHSFLLDSWTDFQPALILKATNGAPLSVGLYASLLLKEKWRIGGFYALREMAGALVQMQVSERLRIGYSFDLSVNSLIRTNMGSHEFSATYDFKRFRKRIVYPRRF